MNTDKLYSDKARLEKELKEIKEKIRLHEHMPKDQQLAVMLHDALCKHNHIDACSWQYEYVNRVHDWRKECHQRYLGQAHAILEEFPRLENKRVILLFKLARGY